VDGIRYGFIIEDEPRDVKVQNETRIPAGKYRLKINKLYTPLTLKYKAKYPWFKYHIELENVPKFTGIYVHVGNKESETAGCQLINKDLTIIDNEFVGKFSTDLFKEWYEVTYSGLEKGFELYWQIIDEK
jgi:hypothetical protein